MVSPLPCFRPAARFAALLLSAATAAAGTIADPAKVTGPEACAECHMQEIEAWKLTKHFKTNRELHTRPETSAMLAKLGLGPIKSERSCVECHYLPKVIDGEVKAATGITCESCHGEGLDWYKTHGDYGQGVTKETETAEHRTTRWNQALAAGLIARDNLYALGSKCYACHVIPDEKLVNVGGHPPASATFTLLTWSQGEVRHTILHTGNKANPEATAEQKRRLFVVGAILETEFCFRAVSRATAKADFGVTLARRADAARKLLEQVQGLAPTPELGAVVAVAKGTALRLNNAAELAAAADRIGALGREFAAKVTGAQLAGVDALLPGADKYQGTPFTVAGSP